MNRIIGRKVIWTTEAIFGMQVAVSKAGFGPFTIDAVRLCCTKCGRPQVQMCNCQRKYFLQIFVAGKWWHCLWFKGYKNRTK